MTSNPEAAASMSVPAELPEGVDIEAALLEAFTRVPIVSKVTLRPNGSSGLQATVSIWWHTAP